MLALSSCADVPVRLEERFGRLFIHVVAIRAVSNCQMACIWNDWSGGTEGLNC